MHQDRGSDDRYQLRGVLPDAGESQNDLTFASACAHTAPVSRRGSGSGRRNRDKDTARESRIKAASQPSISFFLYIHTNESFWGFDAPRRHGNEPFLFPPSFPPPPPRRFSPAVLWLSGLVRNLSPICLNLPACEHDFSRIGLKGNN